MVTLLGGGEVNAQDIAESLRFSPFLVAVDGGADVALGLGYTPDAVIGDLDSLSPNGRETLDPDTVHHIPEQDSTDFDKALRSIAAPGFLAVGFTGRRIDHELAAYHTLIRRPERRCVILGCEDIAFVAPPDLALDMPVGTRVSLFPMAPMRGRSTGLRWPIDQIAFSPWGGIGTSNQSTAPQVRLTFDRRAMLVILPRTRLEAVLNALF